MTLLSKNDANSADVQVVILSSKNASITEVEATGGELVGLNCHVLMDSLKTALSPSNSKQDTFYMHPETVNDLLCAFL